MFSSWCSIHETTLLGEFLSPFSPKYGTSLLKFRSEVVSHKKMLVSKQSFKINFLSANGAYPKLKILVHFCAQFTSGKSKILPKARIFCETGSWWLSNSTSNSFRINQRILIKLTKKIHFLGKNGLFKIK